MISDTVGPLSRPFVIGRLPDTGTVIVVEATEAECAALASDFGLSALHSLVGRLRVTPTRGGVRVTGTVEAELVQTCVVTAEEFGSRLREEVDVSFEEEGEGASGRAANADPDYDPPDAIRDGRIDLGSITAEFLSLGLDPYPRQPGAAFDTETRDPSDSPFSALEKLRSDDP